MYPNMSRLLAKVDSRFTLAILAAKRARQINDYLNSIKRHDLTDIKGPELSVINEKPLSIAFSEIDEGKITYERLEDGIK